MSDPSHTHHTAFAAAPHFTSPARRVDGSGETLAVRYFVLMGCSARMQDSSCSMADSPQGMAA